MVCRSTNFSRTLGTLRGVLTGLYPATTAAVPVTTSSDLDEILYAGGALGRSSATASVESSNRQPLCCVRCAVPCNCGHAMCGPVRLRKHLG